MSTNGVRLFYCNCHAEHSQEIYRHPHRMKSRTLFLLAIGLLILVFNVTWIIFSPRNQAAAEVFPATVNRDCAPWDGAAFTISIPLNDGTMIHISIWQFPDISLPVTYSFPDDTGQVGNALLLHEVGLPEQLNGKVFFWQVNQEGLTEGKFDLVTEAGQLFKGQFKAEWGDEIVYCG